MNKRKGYYFKKGKDGSLYFNVYKPDFVKYLEGLDNSGEWVKFRIFERNEQDQKGHTHNMELIQNERKDA